MNKLAFNIMVVGREGQLAWELRRSLAGIGSTVTVSRPDLDLSRPDTIREMFRRFDPDVVVNAAAYTAVDQAESEPDLTMKANAEAPAIMAEEAKRRDALLIHYSSDYVFDGKQSSPYAEMDRAAPLNVYGASKLAGEGLVQAVGGAYLIVRTSWLYGARGKNFLRTMMRLIQTRDEVRVVDDQIGAPTWSRDVADATLQILEQLAAAAPAGVKFSAAEVLSGRRGIYHMTSRGSISWCGFAKAILEEVNVRLPEGQPLARIIPILSQEYSAAAVRPKNSRLSNDKLLGTFGIELPHWLTSLKQTMNEVEMLWGQETAPRGRIGLRQ
jgi:dTDP-4-dehydrorhamnose reductase